jgi:hypothetical protein
MSSEGYKPAGRTGVRWGCATAVLAGILVMPLTILAALGACAPGAEDCRGDTLIFFGAFLFCALLGTGVGVLAYRLTRNREQ